jgi:hypothetical protein
VNFIIILVALVAQTLALHQFGGYSARTGSCVPTHSIDECNLPVGNIATIQFENPFADAAVYSGVRGVAISLGGTVPAMTVAVLGKLPNMVALSPVSTAGDLKVRDPFIPEPPESTSRARRDEDGGTTNIMNNIIVLKSAPAIAPRGKQPGVFIDTKQTTGTDSFGVAYNNVTVCVDLHAKDKRGNPYRIEKAYNLLGRGFSAFAKDFQSWNLRKLTQDEVEAFNPEDLMKGKPVVVEVAHRKVGTDVVAHIAAFHPASTANAVLA